MAITRAGADSSFSLLASITTRLASMSNLDDISAVVANEIAALGFGAVWMAVLDEPAGHLITVRELIDGRDTTKEMPRISSLDTRQPIGHGFREGRMINVKRPESLLILEDHPQGIPAGAMALPRVVFEHLRGHPFACGPLLGSRGQPVGALGLSSYRGREPLPDELFDDGLLRAFMSHLGIAMERALHVKRLELLNADLIRAQDLLMNESRMRAVGELAAAVAHDLNNLSGIALMALGSLKQADAQGQQALSRAERANDAIGELSRRLQRVARTGGDPRTGAADLRQVVEDVVVLIRPMCKEDAIVVDLRDDGRPALVRGDQTIVRQAVMNVLLNAREAVREVPAERRRIEIRLAGGDPVSLQVRDRGPGIPDDLLTQIFLPFVSSKEGHAGLGLATVRASLRHFAGEVDATNDPDGGAVFRLSFAAATEALQAAAAASAGSLRSLRVLVVDDEPDFVLGMRDLLKTDGHEVASATDGDEAIAKVAQRDFDVVLMDLGLPKRNGLEVIRALRGEGVQSKMVLMTGWDSETTRADARADLCDTVLQKPFKMMELRQVLTTLFAP
jgi:signal transduction histidine kinase/CheY-like chemotaxis protein